MRQERNEVEMSKEMIDLGYLYERAREAARSAVAASPGANYGLTDIMTESQWFSVGSSDMFSTIPVSATLNGCIEALRDREVSAGTVEQVDAVPPRGTSITRDDLVAARSWLADTLVADVDEDGREAIVARDATDRGWAGNPIQVTSHVLALVMVAGAAAAR